MIGLFDTHCHLDLEEFDGDREEVISRSRIAGVNSILIPSVSVRQSEAIKLIAETHEGIYYALGVHPNSSDEWIFDSENQLKRSIAESDPKKMLAIGEIGLDNYWKTVSLDTQVNAFTVQLRVAYEANLPVIIHSREENNDRSGACSEIFLELLSNWVSTIPFDHPIKERPGVFHSYSGDVDLATKYASLGFYFGFTGPITYKNAEINREVVKFLPSDKIIIETDSPYLSPIPHRGTRNEPAYVAQVALKIAEILHEKPEIVAERTTQNARRLFLGEVF